MIEWIICIILLLIVFVMAGLAIFGFTNMFLDEYLPQANEDFKDWLSLKYSNWKEKRK